MDLSGLYAIVDLPHRGGLDPVVAARALLAAGPCALQVRAKAVSNGARAEAVAEIAPLCAASDVPLVINDDVELAGRPWPGRVGLHLGQEDLDAIELQALRRVAESRFLGISTHGLDQVMDAARWRPDYLGFGPIFATGTKRDADPVVGVEQLAQACRHAPCPVVAIGGIDLEGARACARAGADAVAVVGALVGDTPSIVTARARAVVAAFEAGRTLRQRET